MWSFWKTEVRNVAGENMKKSLSLDELTASGLLLKDNGKSTEEPKFLERTSEMFGSGTHPLKMFPAAHELPPRPPPANECNFTHYYAIDVGEEYHDQYIFRHANGLCVVGLAPSHAAFKANMSVTAVDFNVGKSSRADMKAVGKRKKDRESCVMDDRTFTRCQHDNYFEKCARIFNCFYKNFCVIDTCPNVEVQNAPVLEGNSVLCKVMTGEMFFLIRCCVRGTLLEVNQQLIKNPQLLISNADTRGYIAVLMPRSEDWGKVEKSLLTQADYKAQRGLLEPNI